MPQLRPVKRQDDAACDDKLIRVSDIFAASLVYARAKAEEEVARCTIGERFALERKYGYTQDTQLVTAMVQEAAHMLGMDIHYVIRKVETEKLPVAPKLVTFDTFLEELPDGRTR